MDPTANDLADLLAREAIKDVKARYCRFLDTKDRHEFGRLFTADAVMDVREDTGLDPVTGVEPIVEQVRFAVDHAATSHQVHSPEVELTGSGSARATWAMQDRVVWQSGKSPVEGVSSITGYGQYHETYRLVEGEWKISSLRLSRFHVDTQMT